MLSLVSSIYAASEAPSNLEYSACRSLDFPQTI